MKALLILKKSIQRFQQAGFALIAMVPYIPEVPTAVGDWSGSTAVAIAPNWAIATKHQGGQIWSYLQIQNQQRTVLELVNHPTLDVQLIHFKEPVTAWHPVRDSLKQNDLVYMGGYGLQGNIGEAWRGPREERWGTNKLSSGGFILATEFNAPTDPSATPNEAQFALNDSGSGIFSKGADGKFYMEGMAVSIGGGWGAGSYGQASYAISVGQLSDWIYEKISGGIDLDRNGYIDTGDLFKYLDGWFAKDLKTDSNKDGVVSADDLFGFLDKWFAGNAEQLEMGVSSFSTSH